MLPNQACVTWVAAESVAKGTGELVVSIFLRINQIIIRTIGWLPAKIEIHYARLILGAVTLWGRPFGPPSLLKNDPPSIGYDRTV